jgi:hypothetical protein
LIEAAFIQILAILGRRTHKEGLETPVVGNGKVRLAVAAGIKSVRPGGVNVAPRYPTERFLLGLANGGLGGMG